MRSDILLTGGHGDRVLAVEVKARRGVDRDWAAQLRRNLKAHGESLPVRYFMILTIDEAYLWRESEQERLGVVQPDAVARTADLLETDLTEVDGPGLELHASSWLSGLTQRHPDDLPDSARRFVVQSGLMEALRGAHVELQVA